MKKILETYLTDEQIARFGLEEAVQRQKEIMYNAIYVVKKYAVNDSVVLAQEQVLGGTLVAFELGYDIFASVTPHENGGITFEINAHSGTALPQHILDWGGRLQELYGSGIFIRPDGGMIVAGGPKNPDFSVPVSIEEVREVLEQATG